MSYPTFTIEGALASDPEIRWTKDGTPVTTITIATNDSRKQPDGRYENTEPLYIRCQAWRNRAENIANQLKKGTPVIATGKLKPNNWEKNGEKHYEQIFEIYNIAEIVRASQPDQNPQPQKSYGYIPSDTQAWGNPDQAPF